MRLCTLGVDGTRLVISCKKFRSTLIWLNDIRTGHYVRRQVLVHIHSNALGFSRDSHGCMKGPNLVAKRKVSVALSVSPYIWSQRSTTPSCSVSRVPVIFFRSPLQLLIAFFQCSVSFPQIRCVCWKNFKYGVIGFFFIGLRCCLVPQNSVHHSVSVRVPLRVILNPKYCIHSVKFFPIVEDDKIYSDVPPIYSLFSHLFRSPNFLYSLVKCLVI